MIELKNIDLKAFDIEVLSETPLIIEVKSFLKDEEVSFFNSIPKKEFSRAEVYGDKEREISIARTNSILSIDQRKYGELKDLRERKLLHFFL